MTFDAKTDAEPDFFDIIGLNGPEAKAAAEVRENTQRTAEVDQLLARNGVTREQVQTAPETNPNITTGFDDIATGKQIGYIKHLAKSAGIDAETDCRNRKGCELGELSVTGASTYIEFLQTVQPPAPAKPSTYRPELGERIADNLVPEFGATLTKYQPGSLSFGFPPAIDALITKTGIDQLRAAQVLDNFRAAFALADQWKAIADGIEVTDVMDVAAIAEAKRLHKIIRDERINVEKKRKELKEPSLREGQLIDGVSNVYKELLAPIEKHLHDAAYYVENLEKERKEKLAKDRADKLRLFEVDPAGFPNLGDMTDEAFEVVYTGIRESYHARKKAEADEAAANEERARQQAIENEQLRKENERIEAERKALEAELRRKAEEEAAAERAKREAEAKAAAEAEAKRLAPDKEKLVDLAKSIVDIVNSIPSLNLDAKFEALQIDIKADLYSAIRRIQAATTAI